MLKTSMYYQVVTEESSEQGDFAYQGIIFENREMLLSDIVGTIKMKGFFETSEYPVTGKNVFWFQTVDPHINFETGEKIYNTFHIHTSPKNLLKIAKMAGIVNEVNNGIF